MASLPGCSCEMAAAGADGSPPDAGVPRDLVPLVEDHVYHPPDTTTLPPDLTAQPVDLAGLDLAVCQGPGWCVFSCACCPPCPCAPPGPGPCNMDGLRCSYEHEDILCVGGQWGCVP